MSAADSSPAQVPDPVSAPERPPGYRIGTVAGLTGLDPHTIRAWERRYQAVEPARSQRGTRLYDDACIQRLQLLKALVDCGEAIRHVARLPDAKLREQLQRLAGLARSGERRTEAGAPPLGVALLAPGVEAQLRANPRELAGFRVVESFDRVEALIASPRGWSCDVLVLELPQLGSEPLRGLDRCQIASGASQVVVLYSFARRGVLSRLAQRGVRLVRGPLGLEQLHRALLDLVTGARATEKQRPARSRPRGEGEVPVRRYDDTRLARIAEVSTTIECECPHHLSSLLCSLTAFERYSRDCESRDGEDAAMHQRLADGTARARATMEDLLDVLCEFESIRV
jgi:DNA-binding transcriptional MerR regulator